jgi:hypothetical protein
MILFGMSKSILSIGALNSISMSKPIGKIIFNPLITLHRIADTGAIV